jgi:hypothetical protein
MDRTLTKKGILSAATIAACLIARGASQVYSQTIVPFVNIAETNITSEASVIYEVGPFTVGESHYWTDTHGNTLYCSHKADDPLQSSTYFMFGTAGITVPLSPKRTAIVAMTISLLALGAILSGVLLKKGPKQTVKISN